MIKQPSLATSFDIKILVPADLHAIVHLFQAAVKASTTHYSPSQIKAWAASAEHTSRWEAKVNEHFFLGAFEESQLAGFASLTSQGYVDLLYVHPHYFRKGLGTLLYSKLEQEARHLGLNVLNVHASALARPLFERLGFKLLHENQAVVGSETLTNYLMEKQLNN
jgi:putative acetyltransferase